MVLLLPSKNGKENRKEAVYIDGHVAGHLGDFRLFLWPRPPAAMSKTFP
jgi:hypothetical protein